MLNYSFRGIWFFFLDVLLAWREDKPLRKKDVRMVIIRQIFFTGWQSFKMTAVLALLVGVVTVAQSGSQLSRLGGSSMIGEIVIGAFFRDIGPLLTVLTVIARSVSAMASELSTMRANGEIDGLRGMGVSPLSYLVVPRLMSGAISTLVLAMHFVWIALFVGFIVAQVYIDMPWGRYVDRISGTLAISDLIIFFTKTFVVGFVVFLTACYCGLRTTGATYEVPQATTKAVVMSFTVCFGIEVAISLGYYLWLLKDSGLLGFM